MSTAETAGSTAQESKRCVHCCEPLTAETKDHVFPASWYPDTTPGEVQRWTVPSCGQCNKNLGKIEKEVFTRLALCVDPRKAEAAGLSKRAMRSMGIGANGISPKESVHRKALKKKIIADTWSYEPGLELLPGLGPHPGFPAQGQTAIGIPATMIEAVAKKMVCGSEYVLAGRIIEPPYTVAVYFVHAKDVPKLITTALQSASAKAAHLGPGFQVIRVSPHDEPNIAIYKITLWGSLEIYAAVLPESDLHPPSAAHPA